MIGALLRLLIVVVLVVAAAAVFFGYRWGDGRAEPERPATVGTSGPAETAERGREVGAKVGERLGAAAHEAGEAITEANLTAKIKAKMALDDLVQARDISVETENFVVTLTGRVGSEAERQRALQLARETEGVRSVVDRLVIQ
jgi:hyperosmotically inducible protein